MQENPKGSNRKTGQVSARLTSDGHSLVIEVVGRLGYGLHREFREAYEKQPDRYDRYAINLRKCICVDSTGLGMLLMLRDFCELDKRNLLLLHCTKELAQVLRYAGFEELFTLQEA